MPVTLGRPLIKLSDLAPFLRNTNVSGDARRDKLGPHHIVWDGQKWRCYIEAVNGTVDFGTFRFPTGVMLATAPSPQGPWTLARSVLIVEPLSSGWENLECSPSTVMWDPARNRWIIWFHGGNNDGTRQIGVMYSTDGWRGERFERDPANPILTIGTGGGTEDKGVSDLKILRKRNGQLVGFYTGRKVGGVGGGTVHRVTGTEPNALTKQGQVITDGSGGTWNDNGNYPSHVWLDPEDRMHMFGAAGADTPNGAVGLFHSDDDGATWTPYGSNPVMSAGATNAYDENTGDVGNLVYDGDVLAFSTGGEAASFANNPPLRGQHMAITPAAVTTPVRAGKFYPEGATRSFTNQTATSLTAGLVGSMVGRFKAYRTVRATARIIWGEFRVFNHQFTISIDQASNGNPGQLQMFFRTPTAFTQPSFKVSSQVDDGQWHEFLFRRLGTNSFELWMDGVRHAVDTTTVGTDATATTKSIGNADSSTGEPDNPLNATVSDLVQVNGYALDWAEAKRVLDSRTFPSGVSAAFDFPTNGTPSGDVVTVEASPYPLIVAPPVLAPTRRSMGRPAPMHAKLWLRSGWMAALWTRAAYYSRSWFLREVATGDATANGVTLTATASLIPGSASGQIQPTVNGVTLTATSSLVGAGAAGGGAGGRVLTATASLITGAAGGGAGGVTFTATASLIPGTATGGATANGQTLTATSSLIAGAAGGGAGGQILTATASLIAGSASGGGSATASGVTMTATASLITGSASGQVNGTAAGATLAATSSIVAGAAGGGAGGQTLAATASLIPGTATAGSTAPGTTLTATASLIPGAASVAATAAGAIATATTSLIGGAASANSSGTAPGATLIALAQLLAGLPAVDVLGSTPGFRVAAAARTRIARTHATNRRAT